MASRPATLIESILGIEKAKACEEEIKDRIHPEDRPAFRERLVREILQRHIHKANLGLNDIVAITQKEEMCWDLEKRVVSKIYESNKDGYQVDKNQRSR